MYPLKMKPEIKYVIWGGTKLRERYQKNCTQDNAGESWEVSTHPAGLSVIDNGPLQGLTLAEAIAKHPGQIAPADFPCLFKILDVNHKLSIQVHPDDAYAQQKENSTRGKTELWYIIDAKPGARIGYGWNQNMTQDLIREAIKNNTLEQYINYIPVSAGQTYFVPAGMVHCLCDGLLVAELQQNSNAIYRLYDYNRKDQNGAPRPLHIEQALEVADLSCTEETDIVKRNTTFTSCPYFTYEKMAGNQHIGDTRGAFEILFFIDGKGEIITENGTEPFQAGDTFLLPSSLGTYTVQGQYTMMRCME